MLSMFLFLFPAQLENAEYDYIPTMCWSTVVILIFTKEKLKGIFLKKKKEFEAHLGSQRKLFQSKYNPKSAC